MRSRITKINAIITALFSAVALCVAIAGLLAVTVFKGDYKVMVVGSGSMTPTIPVGSLVVSHKQASYQVGDVITFRKGQTFVTHRIYALKNGQFQTKGDANNAPDSELVNQVNIFGKEIVHVPDIGLIAHYAKTPIGFSLIIILPALWIVIQEIFAIGRELDKMERAKRLQREKILDMRVVPTQAVLTKQEQAEKRAGQQRVTQAGLLFLISITSLAVGTKAYFTSTGKSTDNTFSVGQFSQTTT